MLRQHSSHQSSCQAVAVPERPLRVELDEEPNGRWAGEVVDLPGVLAYGPRATRHLRMRMLWHCALLQIALNTATALLVHAD
jgi:hypothetical protein